MGDFTLDTSGRVDMDSLSRPEGARLNWLGVSLAFSDLTPFAQGYVEALFADFRQRQERRFHENPAFIGQNMPAQRGFSDLAPETLARIIADCEDARPLYGDDRMGAQFYTDRRLCLLGGCLGGDKGFPPLTVTLSDDGKVRFT